MNMNGLYFLVRNVIFRTVLTFLLSGVIPIRAAGPGHLRFERLDIRDGLSQNAVLCFLQDRRGFLWLGTQDGLNLYDGYQFKVFRSSSDDEATLSGDFIQCLYEDRSGTLWVGTDGKGVNRYDAESGTFQRIKGDQVAGINRIFCLLEDRNGHFWMGTAAGLFRFDRETHTFQRFLPEASRSWVWSIHEDQAGYLWVGTFNGLYRLDQKREHALYHPSEGEDPNTISDKQIKAIVETGDGAIWLGNQ